MNPGNEVPWELPPEYHDEPDPPPPDCLNCGRCDVCIQRSAAFAAEMNDGWPDFDDADDFAAALPTGDADGVVALRRRHPGAVGERKV